jgi:hypothetical protein
VGWLQFDPPDERMCQQCKGTGRARYVKHVVLNPSSPLLETEREEDSAPLAQPGDARAKNPTGPMESI